MFKENTKPSSSQESVWKFAYFWAPKTRLYTQCSPKHIFPQLT